MRSTPREMTPPNLGAPQDHPYVLRRMQETLQETRREGRGLSDMAPSPTLRTHFPSRPRKRRRTDTGSTQSTAGTTRAKQHDSPDP